MDYQQITLDYIEGRLSPADYEEMVETDDALYCWFQSIVPKDKYFYYRETGQAEPVFIPYDIRVDMKRHERIDFGGPKGSLGYHHYIHKSITNLFRLAFPQLNVTVDTRLEILNELSMLACPDYIGGSEVAQYNILGALLSDIPVELVKSKRTKIAKERIKQAFHIEGQNYPRWIQDPEWPVYNGKPMKFVKTIRVNREHKQHVFVDVDDGTTRTVDDFF
jgi:hypothetical protein